jgi:hypothetical protein
LVIGAWVDPDGDVVAFLHEIDVPVLSGRRPLVKGCFEAVVNVSGAVMSPSILFLPMAIRGELSFPQGFPC